MFNVTRRVSFAVAIALTVGWGIFFLLFLASSTTILEAQQSQTESAVILPVGVRINVQVDKKVYRGGDTVLIAIRNDSRTPIWIQTPSAECPAGWWSIERLMDDGESWTVVTRSKQVCGPGGVERFTGHTLRSDAWLALVPNNQIGDLLGNPPTGTYRIMMPFLKGKTITATTWPSQDVEQATSAPFSIL